MDRPHSSMICCMIHSLMACLLILLESKLVSAGAKSVPHVVVNRMRDGECCQWTDEFAYWDIVIYMASTLMWMCDRLGGARNDTRG